MFDGHKSALEKVTILKERGNTLFHMKKYKEAVKLYSKAIDKCPKSKKHEMSIIYQNRAAAFEKLELWSRAKFDSSKSLKYNPFNGKAYLRRAKAYERINKTLKCLYDATATLVLENLQSTKFGVNTASYVKRIVKHITHELTTKYMKTRSPEMPTTDVIKQYYQSFTFDPIHRKTPKVIFPKGYIKAKHAFNSENYKKVIPFCSKELESPEDCQFKAEALLLRGTFYILSKNFKQGCLDLDSVISNGKDKL